MHLLALRRLGLRPALFVDVDVAAARRLARGVPVVPAPDAARESFDVAIVTGTGAGIHAALAELARQAKPVLCAPEALAAAACAGADPATPPTPSSFSGSHLRFAQAAERVRALVLEGAAGTLQSFDVRFGELPSAAARSPDYWDRRIAGGGVLIQPGVHVLDLLAWWLGPLTPISLIDDSDGGVEAEALARLSVAGGATGIVELSRLRSLRNSIVLTGSNGRLEFDLETFALQAEPRSLLGDERFERDPPHGRLAEWLHQRRIGRWLETGALPPTPPPDVLAASHALDALQGLYRRRTRFLHGWERAPESRQRSAVSGSALAGRRVLVTGGTGFIGARLVEKLVEHRAHVSIAARDLKGAGRVARFDVRLVAIDLASNGDLEALARGQDVVFSLAYDFGRSGAHNLALHRRFAEACAHAGIARFVHLSSIAVYDEWPSGDLDETSPRDAPGGAYKSAKRAMEIDLAERAATGNLESTVLQPTIVYGPYSAFWTDHFVAHLRAGRIELRRDQPGLCSGVYVDDVVEALIAAASLGSAAGGTYIISGARPFGWDALIGGYAKALGCTVHYTDATADRAPLSARSALRAAPLALARSVLGQRIATLVRGWLGEDRAERLRVRVLAALKPARLATYRPADSDPALYFSRGHCSIARAGRELDFTPAFDLEAGLQRTEAYIRWRYLGASVDPGS